MTADKSAGEIAGRALLDELEYQRTWAHSRCVEFAQKNALLAAQIEARDAEIESLRKQVAALEKKQPKKAGA